VTARPDPFKTHVADQILAALAGADLPMSTPALEDATGYGRRHGQLVYNLLAAMARRGEVERISFPGTKPVYWRRTTAPAVLPAGITQTPGEEP
jgi:hypothetical protein